MIITTQPFPNNATSARSFSLSLYLLSSSPVSCGRSPSCRCDSSSSPGRCCSCCRRPSCCRSRRSFPLHSAGRQEVLLMLALGIVFGFVGDSSRFQRGILYAQFFEVFMGSLVALGSRGAYIVTITG